MGVVARAAAACALVVLAATWSAGCFESGPLGLGADAAEDVSGPDPSSADPDPGGETPDARPEDTPVVGPPDVEPDAAPDAGEDVAEGPPCAKDEDCTGETTDLCAGEIRCIGWVCQPDPATAVICPDDDDFCTESHCDPATGACVTEDLCECEPLSVPLYCGQPYELSTADPGKTSVLDGYPCGDPGGDGAEHVLRFTAPEDGNVSLELGEGEVSGLWVLSGADEGCEPERCVAGGSPPVLFSAEAGEVYAVVVEHVPGPSVALDLRATCGVSAELDCGDGLDEDDDGATDCEDSDCAGTPACPPDHEQDCDDDVDNDDDGATDCEDSDCAETFDCAQTCDVSPTTLSCGTSQGVGTGGGDALATDYACGPSAPAKEVVYRFEVDQQKQVEVGLSASFEGAALYLLRDEGYGCSPNTCMAWDAASSGDPALVQFLADPSRTYYLAVDGQATGAYTIQVTCP
ncbi:MAG: hypothetical protein ACQEXJ_22605 [Myxococcota bacterium]